MRLRGVLLVGLLSALLGPRAAAQAPRAVDLVGGPQAWQSYFPFRLGDSWTYDWSTAGTMAPSGAAVRTRTFDGTSFLSDKVGYKLVSDDGAYHLYTFDQGVLSIHSSSEGGRLLYYDPPVVLAAPDMRVGVPLEVTHAETGRRWTTRLLGLEDVTTPMGRFSRCLVISLEMEGPDFSSRATHYFAPYVGQVAYKYALRDVPAGRELLTIDATLRLARLAGRPVTALSDVAQLSGTTPTGGGEDRGARDLVRRALMKRYTWDAEFPGYRGEWELVEAGRPPVTGHFSVASDLSVKVEAPNDAARATLRNDISSFITQRKMAEFDLAYAEATFARSATRADGTVVIIAVGDPLATTYTIKGNEIMEVSRSVGRLSYTAQEREKMTVEDGRTITTDYDVVYASNQDQSQMAVEKTSDRYVRLGRYWVPSSRRTERTEAGGAPVLRTVRFTSLTSS